MISKTKIHTSGLPEPLWNALSRLNGLVDTELQGQPCWTRAEEDVARLCACYKIEPKKAIQLFFAERARAAARRREETRRWKEKDQAFWEDHSLLRLILKAIGWIIGLSIIIGSNPFNIWQ